LTFGDAKREGSRFTESPVFRGLNQHFVDGQAWPETDYYRYASLLISKNRRPWGCRTRADLELRLTSLDKLFQDIQRDGYRTQSELHVGASPPSAEDEIIVTIDANGQMLLEDGQHRLAIAKLLNLKSVPVKVAARHSDWCRFRRTLRCYARELPAGRFSTPLLHPDLADLPTEQDDDRYELLRGFLPATRGTVCDLGACWGYFSHRFEQDGLRCYAVEPCPRSYQILDRLRLAENRRFQTAASWQCGYPAQKTFDAILLLNAFDGVADGEERFPQLIRALQVLGGEAIFLHIPPWIRHPHPGPHRDPTAEECIASIQKQSGISGVDLGCGTLRGGMIYRFLRKH